MPKASEHRQLIACTACPFSVMCNPVLSSTLSLIKGSGSRRSGWGPYLQRWDGDMVVRQDGDLKVDEAALVQAAQQLGVHIAHAQGLGLAGIMAQP